MIVCGFISEILLCRPTVCACTASNLPRYFFRNAVCYGGFHNGCPIFYLIIDTGINPATYRTDIGRNAPRVRANGNEYDDMRFGRVVVALLYEFRIDLDVREPAECQHFHGYPDVCGRKSRFL